MRSERMSRHLYDIYKIAKSDIATRALSNSDLYASIVQHRQQFIGLRGFNYNTLSPQTLSIVPPKPILHAWHLDYNAMSRDMIYEDTPHFDDLLEVIAELNERVNNITWTLSL